MALGKIISGILSNFSSDFMLDDLEETKRYEYLCNYLLISKYHPDGIGERGDLDRVVIDHKGQFGLDAIAFIVNGNLVLSKEDIKLYAKSKKLDVEILFVQTKTEEKCDTGDLLKTIQATKFFLNDFDSMTEKNENLINAREIYDEIFEYDNYKLCTNDSPKCIVYYVTAANEWDTNVVNSICNSGEREIVSACNDIKAVEIKVLGKDYVMSAYNEIQNSVTVNINLKNCITLERVNGVKEAYIGYLTGKDYLNIICDSMGDIRRRIFYENVRDYQGEENSVNKEIRKTIKDGGTRDQFVLLNNGVTIITKSVNSLGSHQYEISDFQIVNGCQTSNEIFNCKREAEEIFVPVKIIYTTDSDLISKIVKATNRQSPVPEEAFIALTKFHKELQLLFSEYSKELPLQLFYERRSGEEHDIKEYKGKYQIVTLHGLVRAYECVYRKNPHIVHSTNPANIMKHNTRDYFLAEQKPEAYYISSYLFALFVSLQQKKIFSSKDYAVRFYVIMVTRMLMAENIDVPEHSSKGMKQEIELIINIIKENPDDYMIKAMDIVKERVKKITLNGKKVGDVLASQEFTNAIIEDVRAYLKSEIIAKN